MFLSGGYEGIFEIFAASCFLNSSSDALSYLPEGDLDYFCVVGEWNDAANFNEDKATDPNDLAGVNL